MKISKIVASSLCALSTLVTVPALADETNNTWTESDTSTQSNNNAVSTGVGNAGSWGIGSGTSDSLSTSHAEAVSNGMVDNSTDSSTNTGTIIKVVADQELSASSTNNRIETAAGAPDSQNPSLSTGSNSLDGAAFSNYSGVLNNAWNTAPQSNAQATSNLAINGSMGG